MDQRHPDCGGLSALNLLLSGFSLALLSGAVIIETNPDDRAFPPGVSRASESSVGVTPSAEHGPGVNQLLQGDSVIDKRVAELIRIAAAELQKPYPTDKGGSEVATTGSALLTLGLLYFHGLYVQQDKSRALELFTRSRLLGNDLAAIALAWCYLEGCREAPNIRAFDKIMPAVKRRSSRRANYLLYEKSVRFAGSEDEPPIESTRFLQRAAAAGDRHALNERGLLSVQAGRLPEAIEFFLKASKQGSVVAQRNAELAQRTMLERSPLPANAVAARNAVKPNDTRREAAALFEQARKLHRTGTTLPAYARAIDLYQKAASLGHEPAKRVLSLILSRPTVNGTIDPAWMRQTSLIQIPELGAPSIGVSEQLFEREVSPIIDLLPDSFASLPKG